MRAENRHEDGFRIGWIQGCLTCTLEGRHMLRLTPLIRDRGRPAGTPPATQIALYSNDIRGRIIHESAKPRKGHKR
jgi:hypothetical protein